MRRIIGVALIGLGTFLLAAGLLVRFYVGPTLIGAPTDIHQVSRLSAENATYFDAGELTVRTGVTITATSTVRADQKASGGDVAVWDTATVVQDLARDNLVDVQNARYAFDRRTGELQNCCDAAVMGDTKVDLEGIGLFWPIEARKEDVQVFDTGTLRAWPATFDGEEERDGRQTYRFVQSIPETEVVSDLPALPARLFGRDADDPAVEVTRHYKLEATYWLDPRTGSAVDQQRHIVTTLRPVEGPGELVVADMDLRMTPESRKGLAERADEGAAQIRLLKTIVPVGGAALGLPLLAAGLVLTFAGGSRPARRGPRHAAPQPANS